MPAEDPLPVLVLLGDPSLPDASKPGGRFTEDDHDQVVRLRRALDELDGYAFEFCNDHERLLDRLRDAPPRLVLNFCDTGWRNDASRELHVPALLEMFGLPYSGSGPVTLGLCYDKALVRQVAEQCGVPVPWERFIPAGESAADAVDGLTCPAFIKPNRGDGSVGITAESIVETRADALRCIERLRGERPGTDLIAQQFLSGSEYGIGILGNPGTGFDALPALEVDYSKLDPSLPRLLDYGSKTDPDSPYWNDVHFVPARIDAARRARMIGWCERLCRRLGIRDYGRFDFRADDAGDIRLMEVNPNPAWCHDGKLAHMAKLRGERHSDLLRHIVEAASRRLLGDHGSRE